MESNTSKAKTVGPWNKGRLVGQKLPLKLREIWAIRIHLHYNLLSVVATLPCLTSLSIASCAALT